MVKISKDVVENGDLILHLFHNLGTRNYSIFVSYFRVTENNGRQR